MLDVLIVGAGLAGIGAACRLVEKCPQKEIAILEAREEIGGTWSLFRYPGLRSDSDMFTFGYRFRPWQNPKLLSPAADIMQYLHDTVADYGIKDKIRFGRERGRDSRGACHARARARMHAHMQ